MRRVRPFFDRRTARRPELQERPARLPFERVRGKTRDGYASFNKSEWVAHTARLATIARSRFLLVYRGVARTDEDDSKTRYSGTRS